MNETIDFDNFKILRSIWKNTFDKILEIKVQNRRTLNDSKREILKEEKSKINQRLDKDYNEQFVRNKM